MSKLARSGPPGPRSSVKSPITSATVARIQGAVARQNNGGVPKGSYVGRMQQAAAKAPK